MKPAAVADDEVINLAKTLIDIPSTTDDEAAVGVWLEQFLAGLGFDVLRQKVSDTRFNLWARSSESPRVVLCSHIDTVPPFFPSHEDAEYLYGRGACDTKGIIAAMLLAARNLRARGVDAFGFLLVVGEETDSIGARLANDTYADQGVEFLIVGEPTESSFVAASKGAMTCTIRFAGKAAHSAYPERGDSAVLKLTRAVEAIYTADWGKHETLGVGTPNVGVIRGGQKANIIPAEAEADLIFRTVSPPLEVVRQLEELIRPFDGTVVRWHGNPPMFMVIPEGETGITVAFNTDVPHLAKMGKPLLFGPGSILDAHSATERISLAELRAAVKRYEDLVVSLLDGRIKRDI